MIRTYKDLELFIGRIVVGHEATCSDGGVERGHQGITLNDAYPELREKLADELWEEWPDDAGLLVAFKVGVWSREDRAVAGLRADHYRYVLAESYGEAVEHVAAIEPRGHVTRFIEPATAADLVGEDLLTPADRDARCAGGCGDRVQRAGATCLACVNLQVNAALIGATEPE